VKKVQLKLCLLCSLHRVIQSNCNQRESINYESTTKVWNSQCLSECLNPLHEQQKNPKNPYRIEALPTKLESRRNEKGGKDVVLLLLKSMHGLNQAPRTLYKKLRDGLLECGFIKYELSYACL
jgi:hypothetical protein